MEVELNENQHNIILSLIDREIENFNSVYERTGKSNWLKNIEELKIIKSMLEEKDLKEKMDEIRQVKDVVFKNDTECCVSLTGVIKDLIKKHPNDYDLGLAIREYYLENLK